jgi:hypothetical protein
MAYALNAARHVLLGGDEWVTSDYGARTDPVTGKTGAFHHGIDLISGGGERTVVAFADGKVTATRNRYSGPTADGSAGKYIRIDHGYGVFTLYKHLKQHSLRVAAGDTVKASAPLATMGNTGHATGVHLHFDVEKDGVRVDPTPYLLGEKALHAAKTLFGNSGDEPTLTWGNTPDPDVKDLQALLRRLGDYGGPVDGVAGKYTLRGAKRYAVKTYADGEVAQWVQQRLKSLGYYHGLVDGEPRSLTEKAIAAFERDYALTADKTVADNDWYYLLAVE